MKPKITNMIAWQQAEILMQPTLIRVVDHLRQKLEDSVWKGTYYEVQKPIPGYELCLEYQGEKVSISLWDLCYQICFSNYGLTHSEEETVEVEIDLSLIDDNGEVDWNQLEEKVKHLIEDLFQNLPKITTPSSGEEM